MKALSRFFGVVIAAGGLTACATQPITQEALSRVSPFEMCVAGEMYLLTGSVAIDGHPVSGDALSAEGMRRNIDCNPRDYYQGIARSRLQQGQIAAQNNAMQEQAAASAMQGIAQQIQAQKAADAQRQAAYYQNQQNSTPTQATTTCQVVLGRWTCTTH
jgi:hypothetical protein